jgi:hypothetical protein
MRRDGCIHFCSVDYGIGSVILNNYFDIQTKLARKFKIALVMGWDSHDRTGTIGDQHIIRNPDRDLSAIDRVNSISTGKHAAFFFISCLTLDVALP